MKRLIMMLLALAVIGGTTEMSAQGWLKKLGKKAEEAAKRKIEQKVEQKTEQAVDDVFEGNVGKKKNNNNSGDSNSGDYEESDAAPQAGGKQKGQSLEMTYAKSDFVAGDEIIFDDPMDNEQLGEFPSQWDLKKGSAEVSSINGKKAVTPELGAFTEIRPFMKDMANYLPEKFTIEMDILMTPRADKGDQYYRIHFYNAEKEKNFEMTIDTKVNYSMYWDYTSTSGESVDGNAGTDDYVKEAGWHHLAISFNKRALKMYLDGVRFANIPNMSQPANFLLEFCPMNGASGNAMTNFRMAQGAVPLYDRMMSEGKFITYGITFDVGKSTIKPESMGEINRIVQLMNENPELKFSVEGHTDSTGNANSNQTLSEARSQAIVAKLVEMGIAQDRLTAVGKGQNNPIADNSTDEGRAKNRRVEFVKM